MIRKASITESIVNLIKEEGYRIMENRYIDDIKRRPDRYEYIHFLGWELNYGKIPYEKAMKLYNAGERVDFRVSQKLQQITVSMFLAMSKIKRIDPDNYFIVEG